MWNFRRSAAFFAIGNTNRHIALGTNGVPFLKEHFGRQKESMQYGCLRLYRAGASTIASIPA